MKLIDADKVMEKLEAGLDNPEEFPVMELGSVMRMIDREPEVINLQKIHETFDEKASVFAKAEEEAREKGDELSEALFSMLRVHAESYWRIVIDNLNTGNEHYSTNA